MAEPSHFEPIADWAGAESRLGFTPLTPEPQPKSLRIHVRDHKLREVEPTLEADFGDYSLSQARREPVEARRLAYQLRYGAASTRVDIGGREAVAYELGPMPDPSDIDPRPPAVVTWADHDLFVLLASDSMTVDALIEEAKSLYSAGHDGSAR